MSFDLHLTIPENSPEGQSILAIVQRESITPEEAVLLALRHPAVAYPNPGQKLIGLFSSEEDVVLIDEVMALAHERRKFDVLRDFDL